ncbi:MAG: flagellar hook assembly protein FlgD [Hyphomonadaceae bacterium]|nr:flagellar hook assembly protein FlgD [Hyphomonadaceae bacterium]
MTVTSVTDPTAAQSQATGDRTRLSDNYDTFLVLLTSQLQNQDPLAPMDSTQFTQQLVQFSQVEQQIRTNEQLEGLVTQYQAASAGAALSYLGKDAIIQSNTTTLAGGQANWAYRLPTSATSLTINVKDSSGRTVYTTDTAVRSAGEHLFTWDGKTSAGASAPNGVYTIEVKPTGADGNAMTPTVTVRETIMGVDFSGTSPVVITPSGTRGLDTIRSVLDRN